MDMSLIRETLNQPRFDPSLPHSAAAEFLAHLLDAPAEGFNRDVRICGTCGKEGTKRKCMRCCRRYYCDEKCQRLDWETEHKRVCTKAALRGRIEEVEGHLGEGWNFDSPDAKTEFAEMLLEVTGQRPELSRALAIHLGTGGMYAMGWDGDDDICGMLSLVFNTTVKKKHLRTLERCLPPAIAQDLKDAREEQRQRTLDRDAKLKPLVKDCLNIGKALKTVLPGLALVKDNETHPTNRHLVEYVFNRLASDTTEDKGNLIADALDLADEYLTPPYGRWTPDCPMSEDRLSRYRDVLRKKINTTWLAFANATYFAPVQGLVPDDDDPEPSDDEKVVMAKKMNFIRRRRTAGSMDINLWLKQPGNWVSKGDI